MPYNQFVREQLAGDLLSGTTETNSTSAPSPPPASSR
jgi:hypothetical protein